jgi:ABC-type uncharacterized transport system substrate-binding protein
VISLYHKYFPRASFWLTLFLLGTLLVPVLADPVQAGTVVLVKSTNIPQYDMAAKSITERLRESADNVVVKQIDYRNSGENDRFWNEIKTSSPMLVITIGSQATRGALQNITDLPVIFTMVPNQPNFSGRPSTKRDIGGVTLNIPVNSQFKYLKKALPATRRVGFIYSPEAESAFQAASKSAQSIGLQLVVEKANSERDVPDAIRRMLSEIDAFWMPPDKLMYENIVFRFVVLECFKNGIPIVSVYRRRAEEGIPLAIGVDYEDIGRQTADLVLKRLSNGKFALPVVEQPRKFLLYINDGVVSNLNIKIPDDMLNLTVPVKSGS